jgi:hypothetical protein
VSLAQTLSAETANIKALAETLRSQRRLANAVKPIRTLTNAARQGSIGSALILNVHHISPASSALLSEILFRLRLERCTIQRGWRELTVMNRQRTLRTVRIGAAVVCLLFCAACVVVWVRSYSWFDWLVGPLPRSYMFAVTTQAGQLDLLVSGPAYRLSLWELSSYPIQAEQALQTSSRPLFSRFNCELVQGRLRIATPLWFPALLLVAVAALAGVRTYRFSLYALLIATTCVALVLGLAAALR